MSERWRFVCHYIYFDDTCRLHKILRHTTNLKNEDQSLYLLDNPILVTGDIYYRFSYMHNSHGCYYTWTKNYEIGESYREDCGYSWSIQINLTWYVFLMCQEVLKECGEFPWIKMKSLRTQTSQYLIVTIKHFSMYRFYFDSLIIITHKL